MSGHAPGEPCPVVDLLCREFGEELGMVLLWNATCFPMDDVFAMEQARAIVDGVRAGRPVAEFLVDPEEG